MNERGEEKHVGSVATVAEIVGRDRGTMGWRKSACYSAEVSFGNSIQQNDSYSHQSIIYCKRERNKIIKSLRAKMAAKMYSNYPLLQVLRTTAALPKRHAFCLSLNGQAAK